MKYKTTKSIFYVISLMLLLSVSTHARSENNNAINIEEYHKMLDAINKSSVPDNIKNRLFQDMRTTLIENVRQSNIPDDVKRTLIRDLESTTL